MEQSPAALITLAEWSTLIGREGRDRALIGRLLYGTFHDVATPAQLCHKEPAPIIGLFCAWQPYIPYGIKRAGVAL